MNEKMRELVDRLNEYSYQYYVLDNPTVSDREYDALYDELLCLEKESGFSFPDSPTHRVGDVVLSEFETVRHNGQLHSLDKAKTFEEVRAWATRAEKLVAAYEASGGEKLPPISYVLEYKFDGLTINLLYENGVLVRGATRGNGTVGENITAQVRTINSVPLSIPYQGRIEVQGEGIMHKSVLRALNKSGDESLKNERNAAAGALRNLDASVTAKRKLDAFFYNVGYSEETLFTNHGEMLAFLCNNKFNVNPHVAYYSSIDDVIAELAVSNEKRKAEDFLIDGMVIKINDLHTRELLGYTEKFPRWALAYKFEAEETTTKLVNVEWQVGRTGKITPLAIVEPVDFEGVTVNKATLNNIGDIRKKDIMINSRVWIRRSNDVIPQIMGTAEHTAEDIEIREPEKCPQCGAPVVHNGAHLFCTNKACSKQLVEKLAHFASRDAMDIEGFSGKTAELLIDREILGSAADLYLLTKADLYGLEGFGDKKIDNLLLSIENSKICELSAFIFAVGIPNVGKKTAADLAEHFGSIDNLRSATLEQLTVLPDIGEIVASCIVDFFSSKEGNELVDRLLSAGISFVEKTKVNGVFSGETFVLTGTLQNFSRIEASDEIMARGGKCAESVNKSVSIVLYGEKAGSKLEKAQKLGIRLMDEQEFRILLNK